MGVVISLVQFTPQKLQEYLDNPEQFSNDLPDLERNVENPSCYLDKAWDAVQYVLTGTSMGDPSLKEKSSDDAQKILSLAIYSGQYFDEEQELGMGPASYLTPDQVKQIDGIVSKMDSSFVKERYNPTHMDKIGIYPVFWSKNPNNIEYVDENFNNLKTFYADAASKGHAIGSYMG